MSKDDLQYLDEHKRDDKEWRILRREPNIEIKTVDDIIGISTSVRDMLMSIKDEPLLGGEARRIYNECSQIIFDGLKRGTLHIRP